MGTFQNETDDPSIPDEIAIEGIAHGEKAVSIRGHGRAAGILGEGETWHGIAGRSSSTTGGAGVNGTGIVGVQGIGLEWIGVYGETQAEKDKGACAILGDGNDGGDGVKGHASGEGKAGVSGHNLTSRGPGIFGTGEPAGLFDGNVVVTRTLTLQGVNVLEKIALLEQRIAILEQR